MIIEADGTFPVLPEPSADTQRSALYVTGDLGGGTAVLGYLDESAAFQPYSSGTVELGEQYEILHGRGVKLRIQVIGSTTPAIEVTRLLLDR